MIRKLRSEDRPGLLEILQATEEFSSEEVSVALELIDCALNNPGQLDYNIFVSECDGHISGYHCTGRRPLTDAVFDLYWIVVAPGYKGRGIGGSLISDAENFVKKNNGRWLLIETSSRDKYNPTRNFYLKNGYEELANIHDFYSKNDALVIYGKFFQQS